MKNMLYKAKGALALTLAVSICGAQCVPVFAAEALSAAQQGVQVTPVKELTEEEKAALQLPKLTAEEALAKAKKHSPDLREIQDTLDYLDDTLEFEQLCLDLADKVVHSIISPASIPAFYCYHCKPSCIKMQEQPEKIAELFLDAGAEIL